MSNKYPFSKLKKIDDDSFKEVDESGSDTNPYRRHGNAVWSDSKSSTSYVYLELIPEFFIAQKAMKNGESVISCKAIFTQNVSVIDYWSEIDDSGEMAVVEDMARICHLDDYYKQTYCNVRITSLDNTRICFTPKYDSGIEARIESYGDGDIFYPVELEIGLSDDALDKLITAIHTNQDNIKVEFTACVKTYHSSDSKSPGFAINLIHGIQLDNCSLDFITGVNANRQLSGIIHWKDRFGFGLKKLQDALYSNKYLLFWIAVIMLFIHNMKD